VTAVADEGKAPAQAPKPDAAPATAPMPVLTGLDLVVKKGELVAVIGPVGCGKSALCNMLLGEMKHLAGECNVRGSIGYAAQTAWILNATIEQNITFGMPMDKVRYRRVIRACQLEHDLEILDSGDQTMIGERGINLSGGQKQRVSVARAAYSDKDIIILDDPMSALDPEVGGALFRECIVKELNKKTRILVTHSMDILQQCDRILVLDTKADTEKATSDAAVAADSASVGIGRIREQGTFDELVAAGLDFSRLIGKEVGPEDSGGEEPASSAAEPNDVRVSRSDSTDSSNSNNKPSTKPLRAASTDSVRSRASSSSNGAFKKEGKKLMEKEERERGAVNCHVYAKYIVAGGGFCWAAFVFFWYVVAAGITVMNTAWVSVWTADAKYENNPLGFYLGGLAIVAVLLSIVSFLRSVTMALTNVAASDRMHSAALRSVMTAPMGFFDVTPIGRIISRFSKDLHTMDEELGSYFDFFIWCSLYVVATFVVITVATPWFGLFIIPLLAIYISTVNYFRPVNREAKRLESIARSPVYAHFSETLGGLSTIRAFGDSDRFITTNLHLVDESVRGFYIMKTSDRWLSVRLEILGAFIALIASSLAVVQSATTLEGFSKSFASIAGLSISFAVGVTGLLNWTVRSFAQMEAGMNCAERILHYSENIPQERLRGDETTTQVSEVHKFRKEAWPKDGAIVINNLSMRYRKGTDLVLRNVSFSVESGQRIGVVGRTGAGKSSLMLALLRLVEPESAEDSGSGPITWDGMDTTRVPVKVLRKRIGIIPQTPTLFSGTIRSNLDPFSDHNDSALWSALERCELRQAVEAMDGGLDAKVAEYGENMSQGQRQLLCLGRALLKDCHLLLLDEATSSIDRETDALVQKTIANSFEGCTILTIAHRVETVIENDKILVLDAGKVVEFDTPFALLKPRGDDHAHESAFAKIVMETGEAQYANLLQMATAAHEQREAAHEQREAMLDAGDSESKVETTHRPSTYHKRAASVAPPKQGDDLTRPPDVSIPRVPTAPSMVPVTPNPGHQKAK
jgi:ABC-type multidrug transport system fused ATPase/permease subunit